MKYIEVITSKDQGKWRNNLWNDNKSLTYENGKEKSREGWMKINRNLQHLMYER